MADGRRPGFETRLVYDPHCGHWIAVWRPVIVETVDDNPDAAVREALIRDDEPDRNP